MKSYGKERGLLRIELRIKGKKYKGSSKRIYERKNKEKVNEE